MPIKKIMTFEVKQIGNPEDRTLRFIGSSEAIDRDNDIIEVAGWLLDNYNKNPVFLWCHDYRQPPVGRAINVLIDTAAKTLIFDIKFATAEEYPFADTIYRLYLGGYLRATSVGFIPVKYKTRDDDDVLEMPEWRRGTRFIEQELLELSAVPVPSNPEALQIARSKGIDISEYEKLIPPVEVDNEKEVVIVRIEGGEPRSFSFGDLRTLEVEPRAKQFDRMPSGKPQLAKGNVEIYRTDENRAEELIGKAKDFLNNLGLEAVKFIVDGKESDLTANLSDTDSITFSFDYLEGNKHGFVLVRPIELLFVKSGAVLSRKNKDALTQAQTLIQGVLDSAEPAEEDGEVAGMWDSLKQVLDGALKVWREKKEAGDQLAPCYVDAYACMLHNMEHIERGELPENNGAPPAGEIDLEGIIAGQARDIDLDAIEAPKPAGGQELNIEPETLKQMLQEAVKEALDRARGKVS